MDLSTLLVDDAGKGDGEETVRGIEELLFGAREEEAPFSSIFGGREVEGREVEGREVEGRGSEEKTIADTCTNACNNAFTNACTNNSADTSANTSEIPATQSKVYTCPWEGCGKSFARKPDLNRHYCIHTGKKPFVCLYPSCRKSFIQRSALTIHTRVHTGERPHKCPFCHKRFADASTLARHRKTHEGIKPYKCGYAACGKEFLRRAALEIHVRTHTGEKPFVCEMDGCSKRFGDSASLSRHRKGHRKKRSPRSHPIPSGTATSIATPAGVQGQPLVPRFREIPAGAWNPTAVPTYPARPIVSALPPPQPSLYGLAFSTAQTSAASATAMEATTRITPVGHDETTNRARTQHWAIP